MWIVCQADNSHEMPSLICATILQILLTHSDWQTKTNNCANSVVNEPSLFAILFLILDWYPICISGQCFTSRMEESTSETQG